MRRRCARLLASSALNRALTCAFSWDCSFLDCCSMFHGNEDELMGASRAQPSTAGASCGSCTELAAAGSHRFPKAWQFFTGALTLLVAQPPEAAAGAAAAAALPRLRLRLVAGGGTMAPDEMFDVAEGGVIMAAAMSGEAQGFRGMSFFSFPSGDGVWRQQLFGVTNDVKNIAHVVRTKPGGMPSKSDTRVVAGDTLAVYGKAKMGVSPPHLASFLVELPAHDAAEAALGDAAVLPRPLAAAATTPAKVPFGADKPVVSGGSDERHDRRRCSSLLKAAVAGNNAQTLDQSAHDAALDGAMPNVACVGGDLPPPVRAVLARTRAGVSGIELTSTVLCCDCSVAWAWSSMTCRVQTSSPAIKTRPMTRTATRLTTSAARALMGPGGRATWCRTPPRRPAPCCGCLCNATMSTLRQNRPTRWALRSC